MVSDWLMVRITATPGASFLDRMIALVEGAKRQKTPNEIALAILLAGLTLIFLIVVVTLPGLRHLCRRAIRCRCWWRLLVTLIPTTIGGLLSAIGIAGMDRLVAQRARQVRPRRRSGRRRRHAAAGQDRHHHLRQPHGDRVHPAAGRGRRELAELRNSPRWPTRRRRAGRSSSWPARNGLRGRDLRRRDAKFIPFTRPDPPVAASTSRTADRKGAVDAVLTFAAKRGMAPGRGREFTSGRRSPRSGGTPLAVAEDGELLGVIHLKDVVKPGIKERFAELRRMGIRTVMVTGDNPLTAAAIAAEAGVDDFLAEATPEKKLELIRNEQAEGRLVAMCGDGTNDAPALAQADVGVAMQTGTPAAREAGNMVDLDCDPTKLIEIVAIGKQMLMTRGALTTFSIANDVAKYFAIIPALFVGTPALGALNIMGLARRRARSCRR